MHPDPFTAADPLYMRARGLGNRHEPLNLARPGSGVGRLIVTFAAWAIWFFLLGFVGRVLWQFHG